MTLARLLLTACLVAASVAAATSADSPFCPQIEGQWGYGLVRALVCDEVHCYYGMGGSVVAAGFRDGQGLRPISRTQLEDTHSHIWGLAAGNGLVFATELFGGSLRVLDSTNEGRLQELARLELAASLGGVVYSDYTLYVSALDGDMSVVDVHEPSAPSVIATIEDAYSAAVEPGRLFTVGYAFGVYDIADPRHPVKVGSLEIAGGVIAAHGDFAYVVGAPMGFKVVDVTQPESPQVVGAVALDGTLPDIAVEGDFAYVAAGEEGMYVVDVSDATTPAVSSVYRPPGAVYQVETCAGFGFVGTDFAGVRVVDVASNPGWVTELGEYDPRSLSYQVAILDRDHVLLTDYGLGLRVMDVSNPLRPQAVGLMTFEHGPVDIAVRDELAFLVGASGAPSLTVVDFSEPENPVRVGMERTGSGGDAIWIEGDFAYTVFNPSGHGMLQVISIEDPQEPRMLGDVDFWLPVSLGACSGLDVTVVGHNAFVACTGVFMDGYYTGLLTVDVADPDVPVLVGGVELTDYFRQARGVARIGDRHVALTLFAGDQESIKVFDVGSDPANPTEVWGYDRDLWAADSVEVQGHLMFVTESDPGWGGGELLVFDVFDPDMPQYLGNFYTGWDAYDVTADWNRAYIADGWAGVQILDLDGCRPDELVADLEQVE